jgi:hypothetical protein
MNSLIFNSTPNLHARLPATPTLVNIQEAADTSVTALPTPPLPPKRNHNPSMFRRALRRIKTLVSRSRANSAGRDGTARELWIGAPTGFEHRETGGPRGLREPVQDVYVDREGRVDGDEWVDVDAAGAARSPARKVPKYWGVSMGGVMFVEFEDGTRVLA